MLVITSKRRLIAWLCVAVALQGALVVFLCFKQWRFKDVSLINYTIVLDAGHGGIDGGVTANGVKESDLNLTYAKHLGQMLKNSGFCVVYTRTGEGGLYGLPTKGFKLRDMRARQRAVQKANPNLVVSIHMNKFSSAVRFGPQVFFQKGNDQGEQLANCLQKTFNAFTGTSREALCGDFFICREVACPSVIVECGFLSNPNDAQQLQTDSYRQALCNAIFNGIMLYMHDA